MKRLAISVASLALLVAVMSPVSHGVLASSTEPPICNEMTPSRILQNPALAHEYAEALGSGRDADVRKLDALIAQLRAVHGCGAGAGSKDGAPAGETPRGHPPIGGPGGGVAPRSPATPLLDQTPATVSI
jgi:hypothetical protein